jgi:hypothetical protein
LQLQYGEGLLAARGDQLACYETERSGFACGVEYLGAPDFHRLAVQQRERTGGRPKGTYGALEIAGRPRPVKPGFGPAHLSSVRDSFLRLRGGPCPPGFDVGECSHHRVGTERS